MRRKRRWIWVGAGLAVALLAAGGGTWAYLHGRRGHEGEGTSTDQPALTSETFTRDVAPILYENCVSCHHDGGSGPFSLITYDDVHRHGKEIAKALTDRTMPPWGADGKFGQFIGDARLRDADVELVTRWIDRGMGEGNPAELPTAPTFSNGWELGKPDLVLPLKDPYTLQPEGKVAYHCFVLPTGLTEGKYIRAVELDPGNARVMRHAFLMFDRTGGARRRAAEPVSSNPLGMLDPGPGIEWPAGQNLSWEPGKKRCIVTEQSPWLLPGGADLVVQMHLRPTGTAEVVVPKVALYFAEKRAAVSPVRVVFKSTSLDIPAGQADYHFQASYALPVDVEALSLWPHMHYLGKAVEVSAFLPDGKRQPLLTINRWDFNWERDYQFVRPVKLPKGTMINLNFTYDNSEKNPQNPHSPPDRVTYGPEADDEMGELALQVMPKTAAEGAALARDFAAKIAQPAEFDGATFAVSLHPESAKAHAELAMSLIAANRGPEAVKQLEAALKIDANQPIARRAVAQIAAGQKNWGEAVAQYRSALTEDPNDGQSMMNLGIALALGGRVDDAIEHLRNAVKISPGLALARANLAKLLAAQGKREDALREMQAARAMDPEDAAIAQAAKELGLK